MITTSKRSNRTVRRATRVALAALALACVFSAPALAGRGWDGHGEKGHAKQHQHGRQSQRYRHHAEHDFRAPARFVAPVRLYPRTVAYYEPYFDGRVWFGPHRHYHAVYRFPVYGPAGLVYLPHEYCGGSRFQVVHEDGRGWDGFVSVSGDRFDVAIGF